MEVKQMMIEFNPEDYECKTEHHTCQHHKNHPEDRSYPGCTCSSAYSAVRKKNRRKEMTHVCMDCKKKYTPIIAYNDKYDGMLCRECRIKRLGR